MRHALDHDTYLQRQKPWIDLESDVVRLHLRSRDSIPRDTLDAIRYVLTAGASVTVRADSGEDLDVRPFTDRLDRIVFHEVRDAVDGAEDLWDVVRGLPRWTKEVRQLRKALLERHQISRERLDLEWTTRNLVVATGGGGGAGYAYIGAYSALDRKHLRPGLLVGTSMGALANLFRSRRAQFDLAPIVAASRKITWPDALRVLEMESRYGLPATLRLYLRAVLGSLFLDEEGVPLRLDQLAIPTQVVVTGITVGALKHDLDFYEHFLDRDVARGSLRSRVRAVARTVDTLREFIARSDALVELVLGASPGTETFDALDAVGFSAAVPGVLHYDVLRDDKRMHRLLDSLYAEYGITRLGEGGLVSNVPARAAREAAERGTLDVRQAFVLALDCFAPNPRRPFWLPVQQWVRSANVNRDIQFASHYIALPKTLSPMNVVPATRDAMLAHRWGFESMVEHMPFIEEMCRPIATLPDEEANG